MERTNAAAEQMCEEEGAAAMWCYERTATPITHPSCSAQGGEAVEESGTKKLKAMQILAK